MENTKKTLFFFLVFCIGTMFYGCGSTPIKQAKTIEEAFPEKMQKIMIDMSLDDFKTVFPEAKRSGFSEDEEVYQFVYKRFTLGDDFDYIYTYFYFKNNALKKYESKKN